ncbi:MAG: DNA polymerase III subunit delta [Acidobacteria bacterium]|nr:DNA polymerase III subunit delta [Acidobacteriota bacterium]
MTPDQFLRNLERQGPDPVYLFVGPETYRRTACRRQLTARVLGPGEMDEGLTRHSLDEAALSEVVDDARAMSLFASNRLIWVSMAEAALPRGRAAAAEDDDDSGSSKPASIEALASYCKDPTPGTVLVFDAHKWDFEGEDKAKLERLLKFYSPITSTVEFRSFTPPEARQLAQTLAAESRLSLGQAELDLLVEATACEAVRIASEIEKLALYSTATGAKITEADLAALVPDAQETTIFNLVNALARRDRTQSMELLDTLIRAGEYLPLALTFLGGVFRMALAAREQSLRSSQDVQNYFQRQGVPMWRSRAEQIYAASARFSKEKLEKAIQFTFEADRDLKSSRPDDRLVMETFILRLTG